jgi:hypothetical protein
VAAGESSPDMFTLPQALSQFIEGLAHTGLKG